jgi:hypothetical protein
MTSMTYPEAAEALHKLAAEAFGIGESVEAVAELLEADRPQVPWDRDIRDELARNDNCPGLLKDGWWQRHFHQIDGVTIHHTLSNSPHATADHYIHKAGGRPSIPYAIWVSETGEVLYCLSLTEGCWHDHTGHRNTHVSVGLAGRLHQVVPVDAQLQAAANVAAWVVNHPGMNVSRDAVRGHADFIYTECPGWNSAKSGRWRERFYHFLDEILEASE